MTTKSYRGNCHCGAFVYALEDVPEINEAIECNCSICRKKGYLFLFTSDETKFSVVKGDEEKDLTSYTFGAGKLSHKFCKNCGTALFVASAGKPLGPSMAINLHSLQDFDTWPLKRKPFDGAGMGDAYAPPQHEADLPSADIANGKIYKGSCHCGDVTVAMEEEELEGHESKQIMECNCSVCERVGAIWTYPQANQVVLSDINKATLYQFGTKMTDKVFCNRCGVFLASPLREMTPEQLAALPDAARKHIEGQGKLYPINTRVLEGLDLDKLNVLRVDGRGMIPDAPKNGYVNP